MTVKHVAIIMDGNGRWAEKRGLPRKEGHRAGSETARKITRAAGNMGIPFLTLYALSTENLYRPQEELDALMALMRYYLDNEVPELLENKVRLKVIGDRKPLPPDLLKKIKKAEKDTARKYDMTLCLAICYGGRDEIVRAATRARQMYGPKGVTEKRISESLDTADVPDPDLIIRTGGEYRISNFLTWQSAYSELYFTKTLWPDFGPSHLKRAIESFKKRERRFGRTGDHVKKAPPKKGKLR